MAPQFLEEQGEDFEDCLDEEMQYARRAEADLFGYKRRKVSGPDFIGHSGISFHEKTDMFDDLLEDDSTSFPLLSCPSEVLARVLTFLVAASAISVRGSCRAAVTAVDDLGNLWKTLTDRDFGSSFRRTARRYTTMTELVEGSAGQRLSEGTGSETWEWDAVMVIAPPSLRYAMLYSTDRISKAWGPRIAAGYRWYIEMLLRRFSKESFAKWVPKAAAEAGVEVKVAPDLPVVVSSQPQGVKVSSGVHGGMVLSEAAVEDILTCVATWKEEASRREQVELDKETTREEQTEEMFSGFGPTANVMLRTVKQQQESAANEAPAAPDVNRMTEEEQLQEAIRLSRLETEVAESAAPSPTTPSPAFFAPTPAPRDVVMEVESTAGGNRAQVVLREKVLGLKLEEATERSVDVMVRKMTRHSWTLLYDAIVSEMRLRARVVAHHLGTLVPTQRCLSVDSDLNSLLLTIPIWNVRKRSMAHAPPPLHPEQVALLKGVLDAWTEFEELASMLDIYHYPLVLQIEQEQEAQGEQGGHTPHVREIVTIAFRSFCVGGSLLLNAFTVAVFTLIGQVAAPKRHRPSNATQLFDLIQRLFEMTEALADAGDDALGGTRGTATQFRELWVRPLERARHLDPLRIGDDDWDGDC